MPATQQSAVAAVDRSQFITDVTRHAARAYLINVAETIQNSLLPGLKGNARAESRALEICGGMIHDMEVTYVCAHSTPRLLARMSRELRAILAKEHRRNA